jgi:hypothetical protein
VVAKHVSTQRIRDSCILRRRFQNGVDGHWICCCSGGRDGECCCPGEESRGTPRVRSTSSERCAPGGASVADVISQKSLRLLDAGSMHDLCAPKYSPIGLCFDNISDAVRR